ncbi:N-formylglutamate amidohydrolase [Carboxylicivirga sediminis]|uniref:N-formylglutamate amidohydrolase n=1 Tax=Carboxylicivirga sediminis TaxID=2006564 RepID=A0A941F3N4_9BACT|nr:N-formylglutamate amidohydrolase [Carboxylicivirga sediminis]MBR8536196.1 N-formylglutamate amidohydrolase [Carboxylicivirga sediminis]
MNGIDKVVVLSCEHGGNEIPSAYEKLFVNANKTLSSHRGYDIGALELFYLIKNDYVVYKQCATVSRLLVDVNRSLHRRTLFSEYTKGLTKDDKSVIMDKYYYGFRKPFEQLIAMLWQQNKTVLHLSVHSFTPSLNGEKRQTDFGILYNPERKQEKQFALIWKAELNRLLPDYRVRFNYPFRGKPDGHVRYYRDREEEKYLGIEFEMNQKYAGNTKMKVFIAETFQRAVAAWRNFL